MTSEQKYFIQILSDYLSGRVTEPREGTDWAQIQSWAHSHQVEGMIYYQCKRFISPEKSELFELTYDAALYYYNNRRYVLNKIQKAFETEKIPVLTVKGLLAAQWYSVPALRTMGDLDILVHKEDKEKAGHVLETLGFVQTEKNPDYDWAYWFNDLEYELHHHLIYQEEVTVSKQAAFFNDYWRYAKNGELDWSFHFLFILAHLRKHLMNKGVGFRMFMDVGVMITNCEKLRWDWIEEKLRELDMLKFAKVCFALIDDWFGIRAPVEYDSLDKDFMENATEKVFRNGVFGFGNEENRDNVHIYSLAKRGEIRWFARLQKVRSFLFPSYNNMANSPFYHFVIDRPWLLPAGWLYRMIRFACGKTGGIKDFTTQIMIPDEKITQRESELKAWGLME